MIYCGKKHTADYILGQALCRMSYTELLMGEATKRPARGKDMGLLSSYMRQILEQELENEPVTPRECRSQPQEIR